MRIVLLAEEAAGLRVLRTLLRRKEEIIAVVTSTATGTVSPVSIEKIASDHGLNLISANDLPMDDLTKLLEEESVDILLNVHALHILPAAVVSAPRIGSFNLHPGPLPELAGLNAPSWGVYLGNAEHAVTLHWMLQGIDTGAIAFSERFPLSEQDTGLSVSSRCVTEGLPLIEALLDTAHGNEENIPKISQDMSKRRFFNASDVPNDGWITWTDHALKIAAFVRAADYGPFTSPWGAPKFAAAERIFTFKKAQPLSDEAFGTPGEILSLADSSIRVATGNGVVEISQLMLDGATIRPTGLLHSGQILGQYRPTR